MNQYLPYFRHFYEVVRAGGFTAASRALRVSQPSISKTIRLLEEQLNVQLLIREKRGVSLTNEGRIFFEACARIFSEVENIQEKLQGLNTVLDGTLKIGASDNLAIHILPKYLADFSKRHPLVHSQLFAGTSTDIKNEIKQLRCEFGIFYTKPEEHEGFDSTMVGEAEFVAVIARKNRWFSEKKRLHAKDLIAKQVPNIGSRASDYTKEAPALKSLKKLGLPSRIAMECNQHESKKKLVELGLGYSILIRHSVEKEVRGRTLKVVELNDKLDSPIYFVHLKNRPLSRIATAFKSEVLSKWELAPKTHQG